MKNIIIFGGSFNPIHLGHINMALKAQERLGGPDNCEVIFVPTHVSVWKHETIDKELKAEMVELVIKKYPSFSMSRFELDSNEINYTYITVNHFLKKYENKAKLYLLIGTDHVLNFHRWKNAEEISNKVQIIYYDRPGLEKNSDNIAKFHMVRIPGEEIDIASEEIRELDTLKNMPDEIIHFIDEHNLYYMEKIKSYIDEKRFNHSKSVARLAKEIAESNNIKDSWRYYVAALLHDVGKNVPLESQKEIEKAYEEYMPIDKKLYHQFYGAQIAEKDFGIHDEEILDAIRYHATGKANMSLMGKIIYAADKTDPLRGYDSSDMINALLKDAEEGFIYVLSENKKFLEEQGKIKDDDKLSKECFDYYLK